MRKREILTGLKTSVSVVQTTNCKLIFLKYKCCRNKFLGDTVEVKQYQKQDSESTINLRCSLCLSLHPFCQVFLVGSPPLLAVVVHVLWNRLWHAFCSVFCLCFCKMAFPLDLSEENVCSFQSYSMTKTSYFPIYRTILHEDQLSWSAIQLRRKTLVIPCIVLYLLHDMT